MTARSVRVGIVDDNVEFAEMLSEYVASHPGLEVSWVATDGEDALVRLKQSSVDLVILDIVMPYLDGLGVLESIRDMSPKPKIIVLTALGREETARQSIALGADYYMVKPFDMDVLVRRIVQLTSEGNHWPPYRVMQAHHSVDNKEAEVSRLLSWFGLSPHVRGYKYLVDAIGMAIDDPDIRGRVTTELYPGVALNNGTSPQRVERAIRHAIRLIWDKGERGHIEEFFGRPISTRKKPTNSEFIAWVSETIRLGQLR
jgi:two-component system response regulator (stage 0 sporulation protein A)